MRESEMKKLVNDLAKAKSEQDILGALAIYHAEARLISIGLDIEARGSAEITRQLSIFFSLFPDYRVELNQIACNDQSLLATGVVTLTPSIPDRATPAVKQPCAFAFTFKDGRIFREGFYLDFSQVCQKANISPTEFKEATNSYIGTSQRTGFKHVQFNR